MPVPVASVEGFPLPGGGTLDLAVSPGEVVLLRGPNGTGKTSLLRAFAGLGTTPPSLRRTAPANVQLLTQDPRDGLVGLTVQGEFRLRGLAMPPSDLGEREVATLSSGEARRVAFDVVRAARPPLLLLDEPAEGLDALAIQRLHAEVRAVAQAGGAVVCVDHTDSLDHAATRRVALAPETRTRLQPLPAAPRAPEVPVLRAPALAVALGGTRLALPGVSLGPGLHVAYGPNGSGKSTLLLRLAGLAHAWGVHVGGGRPRPGANVRLLLPRARDLFTRASVAEELAGAQGPARDLVPDALARRHALTLSGGEAQRLALAKTLGRPAAVYLLDEPDAHLDTTAWPVLRDTIAQRVADGACVLAATHDPRLLALAHSIVRMEAA